MSAIDPIEMRGFLHEAKGWSSRLSGHASAAYWTDDTELQDFLIREILKDFEEISKAIKDIKANFDDLEAAE
jgi:ADP-ribosylglycohydrolase